MMSNRKCEKNSISKSRDWELENKSKKKAENLRAHEVEDG